MTFPGISFFQLIMERKKKNMKKGRAHVKMPSGQSRIDVKMVKTRGAHSSCRLCPAPERDSVWWCFCCLPLAPLRHFAEGPHATRSGRIQHEKPFFFLMPTNAFHVYRVQRTRHLPDNCACNIYET